jgi:hypothetical protein
MEIAELKHQRKNALELARGISKKAEQEKREMTAEEQTNYRSESSDLDTAVREMPREARRAGERIGISWRRLAE